MSTYANKKGFGATVWDYLTTVDHKKIAILYLISGGLFFVIGGLEAMFIRIQLAIPNNDFVSAGFYNEILTMHGTTMIFLAAMPLVFAVMNAVVPLQIGARDVAFPFLNSLGFWLFFFGGIFLNLSWFLGGLQMQAGHLMHHFPCTPKVMALIFTSSDYKYQVLEH